MFNTPVPKGPEASVSPAIVLAPICDTPPARLVPPLGVARHGDGQRAAVCFVTFTLPAMPLPEKL